MLESTLFYLFSTGVIVFALGVVTARSAVYGVLSLVGAMCMMAGLFALLKAFLVATVLVLVYAGAILVLFLFIVMLVDFQKVSLVVPVFKVPSIFAAVLGVVLFVQFFQVIRTVEVPASITPVDGTAQSIGRMLFYQHILPFELTAFLILAAVVSVVVLAKRDAE